MQINTNIIYLQILPFSCHLNDRGINLLTARWPFVFRTMPRSSFSANSEAPVVYVYEILLFIFGCIIKVMGRYYALKAYSAQYRVKIVLFLI